MIEIKNVLVTGGAGFIGSNIVATLLKDVRVGKVRVLDDLSNGYRENIVEFMGRDDFEFLEGDIRDYNTCLAACKGMDLVSHQAALGSVPRSIKDPILTDSVNTGGTLNMFNAVKEMGLDRIVFAASSSTYGDSEGLPKIEHIIGKPLSPYAITKYVNELYADVFAFNYDFEYIGLRYFNIFGPKQDPNGAYAAVIPLFFKAALEGKAPVINGDGSYSRDFTYVDNAVQANVLSLFADKTDDQETNPVNQIYNIAYGQSTTLLELWQYIQDAVDVKLDAEFGPFRVGDIPHSLADISKAETRLGYEPDIGVRKGLELVDGWFKKEF
ncbi:SDR family oxidoreductase [Saprospiraceae bacterium]|nr:SDR family oxidoreductase [Saprospiraceae bacterium]MDC1508205.1 SDR family oxidoreductase [Saprospiraceae bacterium]